MKLDIAPDTACAARPKPLSDTLTRQPSTAYKGLRNQFVALVSAQLLLLVGLAAPKAYTLCHGQTVTLEATLYDPSDPFRGEYANLSFTGISTVPTNLALSAGEAVYVKLSKSPSGTWTADSVARERGTLKPGQIALKGTTSGEPYAGDHGRCVGISYGFEHFFTPQGKSNNMAITKETPLMANISVDSSGDACIKQISFHGHQVFDAANLLHPFTAELL